MPLPENQLEIVKGGETCIQIVFSRSRVGQSFTIKIAPHIEDMVRSWGSGQQIDVGAFGRYWTPVGDKPLKVWDLALNPGVINVSNTSAYRMDQVGMPILIPQPDNGMPQRIEMFNLSFLRLVGASEGEGVSFGVKAVAWTPQEVRRINQQLQTCCSNFYIQYLKPVKLIVRVVTEEARL